MANTLNAALVTDHLADAFITVANNKLAPLRAFSRDFGTDPLKPRAKVQVAKASSASAAQTNPTNFETGDTTVDAIPVTVNQVSKSFQISNDEFQKGFRLQKLAQVNADVFVNAISDVWTALLIAANFPAPSVIGLASAFDSADLPSIWDTAKNFSERNLVLDGSYLARLLPTDKIKFSLGESGAYSFDFIGMQNRWTGAVANTVGLVAGPDAVAVASGLPAQMPEGEALASQVVTLKEIGLSVSFAVWFARASRTHWASYDVMFGAAAGDISQLKILVSA